MSDRRRSHRHAVLDTHIGACLLETSAQPLRQPRANHHLLALAALIEHLAVLMNLREQLAIGRLQPHLGDGPACTHGMPQCAAERIETMLGFGRHEHGIRHERRNPGF